MMKFENVEQMDYVKRIVVISNEILNEYPSLAKNEAIIIASLCDVTGAKVTNDDVFKRYYYMLLSLGVTHPLYNKIFKDMNRYCYGKIDKEFNKNLYKELLKYKAGLTHSFPLIKDIH